MFRKVARPSRASARGVSASGRGPIEDRAGRVQPVLALQRAIGNQATGRVLQRENAPKATIFLKIELERAGPLKGDSKAPGHVGEIEVTAFRMDQGKRAGGGGTTADADKKATLDIQFMKAADSASPHLMMALTAGDSVKSAEFVFAKADDKGKFVPYLEQQFKDGFITNIQHLGAQEDMDAAEEIHLNASRA